MSEKIWDSDIEEFLEVLDRYFNQDIENISKNDSKKEIIKCLEDYSQSVKSLNYYIEPSEIEFCDSIYKINSLGEDIAISCNAMENIVKDENLFDKLWNEAYEKYAKKNENNKKDSNNEITGQ